MSIYDNLTNIYPDLNPSTPPEPQLYRLNKLSEIEAYFLKFSYNKVREQIVKKNETIQFNYRHRRHRPNYINSNHCRNKYCSICQWCLIAC